METSDLISSLGPTKIMPFNALHSAGPPSRASINPTQDGPPRLDRVKHGVFCIGQSALALKWRLPRPHLQTKMPLNRLSDPISQFDCWNPAEYFSGQCAVRSSLHRVIGQSVTIFKRCLWPSSSSRHSFDDEECQIYDCGFLLAADVHRPAFPRASHETHQARDAVIDILETSCGSPISGYEQLSTFNCSSDEATNDPAIACVHAWAIGIEDASYTNLKRGPVLDTICVCQSLRDSFAFIVAGPFTEAVDIAKVGFVLGVSF